MYTIHILGPAAKSAKNPHIVFEVKTSDTYNYFEVGARPDGNVGTEYYLSICNLPPHPLPCKTDPTTDSLVEVMKAFCAIGDDDALLADWLDRHEQLRRGIDSYMADSVM